MPFKDQHPLYHTWRSMRDRCLNPNSRAWKNYGGRGIKICSRWNDFHAFLEDMGPRPDSYTLDRIDNDQGYFPENCRWASRKQQQRNRRVTACVEIEGCEYVAIDLAEKLGVKTDTILIRASRGLTYEEVMSPQTRRGLCGNKAAVRARQRTAKERTHCSKGHEFTEKNTLYTKERYKRCRECHNAKMRRLNAVKGKRKA